MQFKMKTAGADGHRARHDRAHGRDDRQPRQRPRRHRAVHRARERQPHRHPASRRRRSGPRERHHQDHGAAPVPPRRRRRRAPTPDAALATVPANMKNEVDILPGTREDALGRAAGVEYYAVRKTVPVTGTDLKNARVQKGQLGQPNVGFSLTPDGARKFGDLTGANVNRRLAIVLDNKVVSAPIINSQINDSGVIEGNFTPQQAADLSLVLRSGSLPASLTTLEERTVGPSLGRDSIRQGVLASLIGFIALILSVLVLLQGRRHQRGARAAAEPRHPARHDGALPRHADAARHRRHHPDARHGHRLERARLRAHPRGAARRQDWSARPSRTASPAPSAPSSTRT